MANQLLIGQMQDSLQWRVWVGGHTWKMTQQQTMEFLWCPEIFSFHSTAHYHSVSQTQEKWPSKQKYHLQQS